ncbi:MAG: ferritin-like domain-containing protein [Bacteroidetes bacterium]|nr:ferritin-like domain-containing protein [Rhodothermia bacterium]MCS7155493.1 ferritin-like domain-containing protein [Bacteroidota bacterium]MCX7907414.1 ferritin-like domain-containing protein [Bacteroidota bacterium]MDW8138408.1 ferritin-like domain-containing protein [Bacteroidota bacterium]
MTTKTLAREALLEGLNTDLAHEFQAIMMYRLYASLVTGPMRSELREFFTKEIPEELGHAQILADKIAALGGTPTIQVPPFELTRDPKRMLENVLQAERETIERYKERRLQAQELDDIALVVQLEGIIAEEQVHHDEVRQMLENWPY